MAESGCARARGERSQDGDADEDARVARREREREEKRPAQREERPGAHEALEDRVHAAHRRPVGIGHEDDVGHGREDRSRRGQEEAGPERARGPLRLPRLRLPKEQPGDARGESGREREDGLLREDDERERERRKRARRERATGRRASGCARGRSRTRAPESRRERRSEGRRRRHPFPPSTSESPLNAGRGERANGRRKSAAGRSVARLRMSAGLKSRSARFPAPRMRREAGRSHGFAETTAARSRPSSSVPETRAMRPARPRSVTRNGNVTACGMEIPEAEREERPLGDRVRVVDAPRGHPPVEVDERLSRKELPGPVERPRQNEEEPAEDRDGGAAPPRADRAEARERREGRQERGDEVVGVLRRHARPRAREARRGYVPK